MAYFDCAATAPMPDEVIEAWTFAVRQRGNASAVHRDGQNSRLLWEEGREAVAKSIGANPFDVTMTGSGTEAINLAIKGLYWGQNKDASRPRVLTTRAEHHATLDAVQWLAEYEGAVVEYVDVDADGAIVVDDLRARLGDDVALFTSLWVNNEVGTINDIPAIVAIAREHGVPVHMDAVAAWGHVPVDFAASGLAALSVSAHKIGGPVSVGALAVAREWTVVPSIHGGSQQRLRSGSLDVAGVYAAGVAATLSTTDLNRKLEHLREMTSRLRTGIGEHIPHAILRGHPTQRSASNVHITVPGLDSVSALFLLDEAGHAVSAGSACQAGVTAPSHVLHAMGVDDNEGPLRFTVGPRTTSADIDALLEVLPEIVARTTR